eukprot:Phypoly_transcript_12392.p1 GENE.Phypoly_transcript_12392~~Phypoly_transcript_12392.p1  ORF type:complete len:100 (-),score=9.72 Phypoly_transcript_12392:398-697(-)
MCASLPPLHLLPPLQIHSPLNQAPSTPSSKPNANLQAVHATHDTLKHVGSTFLALQMVLLTNSGPQVLENLASHSYLHLHPHYLSPLVSLSLYYDNFPV